MTFGPVNFAAKKKKTHSPATNAAAKFAKAAGVARNLRTFLQTGIYANKDIRVMNVNLYKVRQIAIEEQSMTITQASKFLVSLRGRLILGQALRIAITRMETVEGAHRQVSNIEDMRDLLESGLPIDPGVPAGRIESQTIEEE